MGCSLQWLGIMPCYQVNVLVKSYMSILRLGLWIILMAIDTKSGQPNYIKQKYFLLPREYPYLSK